MWPHRGFLCFKSTVNILPAASISSDLENYKTREISRLYPVRDDPGLHRNPARSSRIQDNRWNGGRDGLATASPYAVGVKGPGEITITALSKTPFLRPLKPWSDSNEAGACRRPALPGLRLQKKRSPKAASSMKGIRCQGSFLPLVTSDQRPVTEQLPAAAVLFTGSQNPRSGCRPGRRSSGGWLFPPGCPRS